MKGEEKYFLEVSNLTVKLQNQLIVDNVSFKLKKGVALSILGPNGAGKTTLLKALLNLVPHEGGIKWAKNVKIGYVPQIVAVSDIPISVKEFLSMKGHSDIKRCLDLVRLTDKSILGKRLGVLSGGELRRVLIAWALTERPNVLMFDEPTSGVDMGSEEPIYTMLKELKMKQGITMFLITHNIHIVEEYTDYVLGLNRCVTYFGESKDVMDPALQQRIYGEMICTGGME
jgi:zinc transport system ATP-binding protein